MNHKSFLLAVEGPHIKVHNLSLQRLHAADKLPPKCGPNSLQPVLHLLFMLGVVCTAVEEMPPDTVLVALTAATEEPTAPPEPIPATCSSRGGPGGGTEACCVVGIPFSSSCVAIVRKKNLKNLTSVLNVNKTLH